MKKGVIFFLLNWVLIVGFRGDEVLGKDIRNVILISWDGVQRNHMQELLKAGKLPNLSQLIKEGSFTEVYIHPFIKYNPQDEKPTLILPLQITPEDEIYYEQAVTDAGHARMLTGRWNCQTGVFEPVKHAWIDYLCGNNFKIVKDNLTLMEMIKKKKFDIYTGVVVSRHSDLRSYLRNYKKLLAIFRGWGDEEIYIAKTERMSAIGSHGFYSTTFKNAEEDLDFFFDSEKIPPHLRRIYKNACYIHLYDPSSHKLLALVELKDDFVAKKALDFIKSISPQNQFFLLGLI